MSALRWPAYTDAEIAECLRLAFASSPLAHPSELHWRCNPEREPEAPRPEAQEPATC